MFVDSSAFLSILKDADDAALLLEKIKGSRRPCKTSSGVRAAVVMALAESRADRPGVSAEGVEMATEIFDGLLKALNVYEVAVSPRISSDGCALAGRFGNRTKHPAQLTLENCMALAAAEYLRLPVLHSGAGFDRIGKDDLADWRAGE